jgi:hypothetical protein
MRKRHVIQEAAREERTEEELSGAIGGGVNIASGPDRHCWGMPPRINDAWYADRVCHLLAAHREVFIHVNIYFMHNISSHP